MSESVIVRCGNCQERMKVAPKASPSQVKCPHCGPLLRIAGTTNSSASKEPVSKSSVTQPAAPSVQSKPQTVKPAPQAKKPAQPTNSSPRPVVTQPQPKSASPFDFGAMPVGIPSMQQAPMPTSSSGVAFTRGPQSLAGNRPNSGKKIPSWLLYLCIGLGVTVLMCAGLIGVLAMLGSQTDRPMIPIDQLLRTSQLKPESYPPLSAPEKEYPSGVKSYFVAVNSPISAIGGQMKMRVFVPAGEHADQSLPCVLIAPAGTPLIHGAMLEPNDGYDAETLPYAEAGFVVIQYSLDGHVDPTRFNAESEAEMINAMAYAFPQFYFAAGGVVNGRNACDYVTSHLKFVDPKRIHCAGHSSAGTVALLMAAHEPRINRCVAFAAVYDVESRLNDLTSDRQLRRRFAGVKDFSRVTSPVNDIGSLNGPIFVFHARDDSNVAFADAEKYVGALKAAGKDVTFEAVPSGEHYDSMINPGIPKAIEWLKQPL